MRHTSRDRWCKVTHRVSESDDLEFTGGYYARIWIDRDPSDYLFGSLARTRFVVTKSYSMVTPGHSTNHSRVPYIRRTVRFRRFPSEAQMIAEVKQKYCGGLCRRCCQAIPLAQSVKRSEGRGDFTARSLTLRCRACDGEGLYTAVDVIDCDGTPRLRGSYGSKCPPRVSKRLFAYLSDVPNPPRFATRLP